MNVKKLTLRDILPPSEVESLSAETDFDEYLNWELGDFLSPLIGGYGEETSYPHWAWVTVVRTYEDVPEGEVICTTTNFWDGLEQVLNLFGNLSPHRTDTGSWDENLEYEFEANDTRGVEFIDAISAVRFDVLWKGKEACVVMDSLRLGRLPRMG